jgi:bifunctional non-homologous end joining protein LigD
MHAGPTHADAGGLNKRAQAIPDDRDSFTLAIGKKSVALTNLRKTFWRELRITKGDLLRYYADVAPVLLPHLADRAMVMKRYPHGAAGPFFFMKRAPEPRPTWVRTCAIEHEKGPIDFPVVDDVATLLFIVNLGCIDLNPWYARCDDVDRPDYLHFDLDPGKGATFEDVLQAALRVRETLTLLGMTSYPKTTGSRGLHVYVPIVRGPTQKEVWTVAKHIALDLARRHPRLMTAEYRVAKRPSGRVVVDYNQNAWGRTLASVYSVRPTPFAGVSMPVTWHEVERGIKLEDFDLRNAPARVRRKGDLFSPLLPGSGPRFDIHAAFASPKASGRESAPLSEYKKKRDLTRSREPEGARRFRPAKGKRLRFVVQKHHASRLHYDFRLEADGVLKSWAIPKGPSLDPKERRLAMQVEDHPLDYYDFEGIIPEGYGAGEVIVWDAGTYELVDGTKPGQAILSGKVKLRLYGKKLTGIFNLFRIRGGQQGKEQKTWLLTKHEDEDADPAWSVDDDPSSVTSDKTLETLRQDPKAPHWRSHRKTRPVTTRKPQVKLVAAARSGGGKNSS